MKRQLDRLKGKRLVTGDPNLMTKDEICINATPNGVEVKEIGTDGSIKEIASGGGGGDSIFTEAYFKLKGNYSEILEMGAEVNMEIICVVREVKWIISTAVANFARWETLPYVRCRLPINVGGMNITNNEELKTVLNSANLYDSYFDEITADEFYNAFNS